MALLKYRVLQAEINDGITHLPEKAVPLSAWVDPITGKTTVAFMMKYEDWAEEFPLEAKEEGVTENTEGWQKDATNV